MNKNLNFEQNLASDKVAYEKPKMMVYEMEIEGAILGGSGSVDKVDVPLGFDPLETEEEW